MLHSDPCTPARLALLLLSLLLSLAVGPATAQSTSRPSEAEASSPTGTAADSSRYAFDVDGMPLRAALNRLAERTGVSLIYATKLVDGKTSACRIQEATAEEALRCMLQGTGLLAEPRQPGRYLIRARRGANQHTMSGFVVDARSGEPLPGAHLYVPQLRRGTTTNPHGFYSLTLPEKPVRVAVSFVGYRSRVLTVDLASDRKRTVALSPQPVRADTLQVRADRVPMQQTTRMSTVDVSADVAKRVPTVLGETDVLKTLQRLPGIQGGSEGTSGLYVRGGSPDQNLVLLDGTPLYYVNHVLGISSVFNPDIVQNVRAAKGGFPARYGGRLSSVVQVELETGNWNEYDVEGNVGLLSSRLAVQGPIVEGKTSFLVAGRRTYADVVARPFMSEGNEGGFYYYDVNARLNHRFSPDNQLSLSLYTGSDSYYSSDGSDGRFGFGWRNVTSSLRWKRVVNSRLFNSTTLRFSRYQFRVDAANETPDDTYRLRYRSFIRDVGLETSVDYDPSPRHSIRSGVDVTYQHFQPGATQYRDDASGRPASDTTLAPSSPVDALHASLYVEDDVTWTDRLRTNLGVRLSGYFVEGTVYPMIQPRVSARYLLPDDWALKGSYALMHQPLHRLTNSSVSLPSDLWVSSTAEVPPGRSHQVVLGISRSFGATGYEASLEAYGKTMTNLLEYRQGAAFDLGTEANWEDRVLTGDGWAYGAELLLRKRRGRLTGWVGYTLSWARRQFDELNGGDPFPFRYDRRHDLTVTAQYQLTGVTSVSATWEYRTGAAITLPRARYRVPDFAFSLPDEVRQFGARNGYRMRPYHRLDLGMTFEWAGDNVHALKVGVYNAYNRKNTFYLTTERTSQAEGLRVKAVTVLPVHPYVGYRFTF